MPARTIEFDPGRLLLLDEKSRNARALQRAASERYADLRDKKSDARRRADALHRKAQDGDPGGRASAAKMADEAEAEFDKIVIEMGEVQSEIDALGTSAGRAHSLFRRALAFADEQGLEIPDRLSDEAAKLATGGRI